MRAPEVSGGRRCEVPSMFSEKARGHGRAPVMGGRAPAGDFVTFLIFKARGVEGLGRLERNQVVPTSCVALVGALDDLAKDPVASKALRRIKDSKGWKGLVLKKGKR